VNCPKCKKPLKTKRTAVHGAECKRERFCKKCKARHFTIEVFAKKYEDEKQAHRNELWEASSLQSTAERKYNDLTEAISVIMKSVKKK